MSSITINSKISFSDLIEIIKNLSLEEKSKIKEILLEGSFEIPEWQKNIVMERSEEYLKSPSIAFDFDQAIKEIEDEL